MGFFDFFKGKPPAIPHEALVPWVHRRQFLELAQLRRTGDRAMHPAFPVGEHFAMAPGVVLSDGEPIGLSKLQLESMGLDAKEAMHRAIQNVAPRLSNVLMGNGLAIWETEHGDAATALIAAPMFAAQLPLKGVPVVMWPASDVALMAGADDLQALERMLDFADRAYRESEEWRSFHALSYQGAEPVPRPWLPPAGHPLRARFLQLAAETRRRDAQEAQSVLAPDLARLAPMTALQSETPLVAAWARESNVLLPKVDVLRLHDTEDSPQAPLDVPFATMLEVMPHAFEALDRDGLLGVTPAEVEDDALPPEPVFWRTRGSVFPSRRELAFLAARVAWDAVHPERTLREESNANTLLARWDSGEPMLAAPLDGMHVELVSVDRRRAVVDREAMSRRLEALHPHDQFAFRTAELSWALMMAVAGEGFEGAAEGSFSRIADLHALGDRRTEGRVPLVPPLGRPLDVEGFENATAETLLTRQAEAALDPASLFAMVRPPGYGEGVLEQQRGMVAGVTNRGETWNIVSPERFSRGFVEGLSFELVSDIGRAVMPLNRDLVPELLHDAVWNTAELNLRASGLAPFEPVLEGRAHASAWNDDYDASRALLVPELVGDLAVRGATLLFAPCVGRVWVAGSDDVAAMTAVLDAIDETLASGDYTTPYQFRQLLFGWPWVLVDGGWKKWSVPVDHPLRARIEALDGQLAKRRASSAAQVGAFHQAVPLSSETVREA